MLSEIDRGAIQGKEWRGYLYVCGGWRTGDAFVPVEDPLGDYYNLAQPGLLQRFTLTEHRLSELFQPKIVNIIEAIKGLLDLSGEWRGYQVADGSQGLYAVFGKVLIFIPMINDSRGWIVWFAYAYDSLQSVYGYCFLYDIFNALDDLNEVAQRACDVVRFPLLSTGGHIPSAYLTDIELVKWNEFNVGAAIDKTGTLSLWKSLPLRIQSCFPPVCREYAAPVMLLDAEEKQLEDVRTDIVALLALQVYRQNDYEMTKRTDMARRWIRLRDRLHTNQELFLRWCNYMCVDRKLIKDVIDNAGY